MGAMPTEESRAGYEQRRIDHEVRLSRAREVVEGYVGGRASREERRSSAAENRWFREQVAAMLAGAAREEELAGLGLSDAMVREARLGDSVAEAWARYHEQFRR
jgi:hypothetical protein